jgi:hypothetical protein
MVVVFLFLTGAKVGFKVKNTKYIVRVCLKIILWLKMVVFKVYFRQHFLPNESLFGEKCFHALPKYA